MAFQIDVPVPAKFLWDVVKDIQHLPEFVEVIESIELDKDEELQVGTKWNELRIVCESRKKTEKQIKTIIRLDDGNEYPKCLGLLVAFPDDKHDITSTNTWTVQPVDENRTVLIFSLAFHAAQFSAFLFRVFQCCLLSRIESHCMHELEDYAREAQKRYDAAANR